MKILSLSVSGAGRFDRRVSVTGFGDGVNVLCESNEAGKSTLFKALRTCLFERHSSNTQDLRDLASEGLSLPVVVRLGFEHGGKTYEIEKSFLKQRRASFREGGREIATNQEADEALWEVLGVAPGSGRTVDQAQFGLLWVSQGKSFEQPALSGAATGALAAAVQAEVGALVGGERARLLLGELRRDIGEFVTESAGKPRAGGPLAQALNESAMLSGAIAEAERKLAAMEAQIERLAQLRRERAETADAEAIREDEARLAAAEAELTAARAARDRLTLKEPMLKASQAALDEARRRERERAERASRIDADRALVAAARGDLDRLAEQEQAASGRLREARAATDAEGAAEAEDEAALARLASLAALVSAAGLRPDQVARRDALAEASRRLGEIEAALAAAPAPDEFSTGWRRWSARSPASAPQSRLAPCVSRSRFSPPARGASSSTASRPAPRGSMRRGLSSSTPAVSPPSPSFRRPVARPNGRSSRRSRRSARRSCARRGSRTGRRFGWRSRSAGRWNRNDRGLSAR